VGAVIVRDNTVVGRGFHTWSGMKHAEVIALEEAGDRARGATLYLTLEPCSHQGRTPPCADAIIAAGIKKVVAAMQDPNPQVHGSGFRALQNAGIEVEIDSTFTARATQLNEAFVHYMRTGRRRRSDAIQFHDLKLHQITSNEFAVEAWLQNVHRNY
jgi:diaminohydroxyphosphoribosylaminopyrimidine deaminase/5-amino-6-(5-phosphoribosylamino)uracil reductase